MKHYLISVFLFCSTILASGQFMQSAYIDAGNSVISSGPFLRLGSISGYTHNKTHANAGFLFTFSSADRKTLSGYKFSVGRDFTLWELPLSADIFFLQNPYSDLTKESSIGILAHHERPRIEIDFGYHLRKYTLNGNVDQTSDLPAGSDLHIWEYRNFMYTGILKLRLGDPDWNASLGVSNYDHFLIQQETNPMFNITGYYKLSDAWIFNAEFWYQGSGMLNLHPNHYGSYIRLGVEWNLGS